MSEWRQIRLSKLTTDQQAAKLKADAAYEIAVQNIYADSSLTATEKQTQKAALWEEYVTTAKANSWWEEITDDALLTERETALTEILEAVNELRTTLGQDTKTAVETTTYTNLATLKASAKEIINSTSLTTLQKITQLIALFKES